MTLRPLLVSALLALGPTAVFSADCSPVPDNLVAGCGFDDASTLTPWQPLSLAVLSWNDSGNPGGAMQVSIGNLDGSLVVHSECVEITTPGAFSFGADFRLADLYAQTWTCRPQIRRYSDTSCTTWNSSVDPSAVVVDHTAWTTVALENINIPTGASAQVSLYCLRNGVGTQASVRVDNVIFREGETLPVGLLEFEIE